MHRGAYKAVLGVDNANAYVYLWEDNEEMFDITFEGAYF